VQWGKRLAAVRIDLARADAELLTGLLEDAWETRSQRPFPR